MRLYFNYYGLASLKSVDQSIVTKRLMVRKNERN